MCCCSCISRRERRLSEMVRDCVRERGSRGVWFAGWDELVKEDHAHRSVI
jgi:hypothetical protein